MPRRCPSEVITHRIEFGTAERQQLKKFARAYNRDKWLENVANIACAGLIGGGIYLGFKYGGMLIGEGIDLAGDVKEKWNEIQEALKGNNPDGTPKEITPTNILGQDEPPISNPLAGAGFGIGGLAYNVIKINSMIPGPFGVPSRALRVFD
jgi:hypothetical protein